MHDIFVTQCSEQPFHGLLVDDARRDELPPTEATKQRAWQAHPTIELRFGARPWPIGSELLESLELPK